MYPVPPDKQTCHLTEIYIGNWLKDNKDKRDKLVIASKACGAEISGPRQLDYLRGGPRLNLSHLEQAVEESLNRLNIDYLGFISIALARAKD